MFGKATKFISSITTAVLSWAIIVTQSPQAAISSAEWVGGGILLAGALGVYQLANKPA